MICKKKERNHWYTNDQALHRKKNICSLTTKHCKSSKEKSLKLQLATSQTPSTGQGWKYHDPPFKCCFLLHFWLHHALVYSGLYTKTQKAAWEHFKLSDLNNSTLNWESPSLRCPSWLGTEKCLACLPKVKLKNSSANVQTSLQSMF